jgi:inorganic triphosphatase YgiF
LAPLPPSSAARADSPVAEAERPAAPEALPVDAEIELKLACAPADLDRLRRAAAITEAAKGRSRKQSLETVYYDTPERDLLRRRAALRVRADGKRFTQTLKTEESTGGIRRGEWNVPVDTPLPDPAALAGTEAEALLDGTGDRLAPLFATRMERTTRQLSVDADGAAGEIEIAFDSGAIEAGAARAPISEVELELKSGGPAALYRFAARLAETAPLHVETLSKAARGYRLAGVADLPVEKKPDPGFGEDATVEEALEAIARSCQAHWLANQATALDGADPEGVHQGRVALRRLRSALGVFRKTLPGETLERLRDEAKWLAGSLGPARDWDVFRAELLAPVAEAFPDNADLADLDAAAGAMRERGYEEARAGIRSPRATAFLLTLGDWLESRGWRDGAGSKTIARAEGPMREEADRQLAKRHRQVLKRGKKFDTLPPEGRHRLRIAIKKLRYLGEFCGPMYGRKRAKAFLSALKDLQDSLGHLNDVAVASRLIADARTARGEGAIGAGGGEAALRGAGGLVIGWHSRGAVDLEPELRDQWRAFRDAKPFWGG